MNNWLTSELVVGTLFVTSFATVGLFALWAGTSRWHWFVRTIIVLLALSPLLLVPAYELLILFTLQAATIALGATSSRLWKSHRSGVADNASAMALRFSLKSLLLWTSVIAVVTAIGSHIAISMEAQSLESWTTILVDGLVSGLAVLLAAWIVVSNRRVVVWPVAAVACLMLAAIMAMCDWLLLALTQSIDVGWPPDTQTAAQIAAPAPLHPQLAWLVMLPAITLLAAFVIVAYRAVWQPPPARQGLARPRLTTRFAGAGAAAILVAACAAFPVGVLWKLLNPEPIPNFATLNPNGFEQVRSASLAFDASPIMNNVGTPPSMARLTTEVAKFAPIFDQVRVGLAQEMRAREWPKIGARSANFDFTIDPVQWWVRTAAYGMSREVLLAQWQQRYGDAARLALDIARLGRAVPHEGTLIDLIVGMAIESIAYDGLYQTIPNLDADECRAAIRALVEIERRREPLAGALARDRIWTQYALGWHGRLWQICWDIAPSPESMSAWHKLELRFQAMQRLLIVELALRAHRLHNGGLPDSLDELIPEWLEQVPADPNDAAGGPLRYVRTDDKYLLYSVGDDGQDDNGVATGRNAGINGNTGDLRLDVRFVRSLFPPRVASTANENGGDGSAEPTDKDSNATEEPRKVEKPDPK